MPVYVLGKNGNALMPTSRFAHVRILLKEGRAKVVKQKPFTIQLLYDGTEFTQPLYGGTDPGRTNIGDAVLNENGETVYADHVTTRNKEIPKLMSDRAAHRRASRQGERKRRQRRAKRHNTQTVPYAKARLLPKCSEPIVNKGIVNSQARFVNRRRHAGWLTPTARQLVQTHLNMVRKICSILPVTDWTLEVNRFAFMKMEDGTVRGVDFQNGRLKGYADAEEYVREMQNGKCAICDSPIEHYHHIVPRSEDGPDGPENLVGLCAHCHAEVHTGKKAQAALGRIGKQKKYAALSVLNQAIPRIYDGLVEKFGEDHVHVCAGFETHDLRERTGLPKTHAADAVCIAAVGADLTPGATVSAPYEVKQYRRHNRAHIHAQRTRAYKAPFEEDGKTVWKTVAKNRKKGFEQKEDSLADYTASLPESERQYAVSKLKVTPSKRHYNTMDRDLPGTVFWFKGKRYVKSGQSSGGKCLRAECEGKKDFPASQCRIVPSGGLVYL